jgi:hypothetical protein
VRLKEFDAAFRSYGQMLQLFRDLAAADPANGDLQRDVAQTLRTIAAQKTGANQAADAVKHYQEAIDITR